VVRGFVLLGLFYLPFHLMMKEESKKDLFAESRTHYLIEDVAEVLTNFLPDSDDVEAVAREKQDDFRNSLLKQNLLPSDEKKPEAEEPKAPESGYNDQQREEIDALFDSTPTTNE